MEVTTNNNLPKDPNGKKRKKKKKALIVFAILLAGILIGTAAFGYAYFKPDNTTGDSSGGNVTSTAQLSNRVSFLLIGADKRPGDTTYNTDTLMVASVDPNTKIISLLSIPRDTRIELNGSKYLKINSVVMYEGLDELKNQVTELTGIELDGYVLTNFDGFKNIIDTLGGIDLYVEMDMYKETGDKVDGVINLKKGDQHLSGTQALQYARYRGDNTADIGRTARQQKVLTAVAKEVLQPSTLTKLTALIPQLKEAVETDLSLADILRLSKAAANFDSSNMVTQTLPGYGLYLNGISFWEVNRDHAKQIAKNLLLGITTDMTIDGTVIDLLDPDIKANITVPGSSSDPNGTASPGHEQTDTKDEDTDQLPAADPDNPDSADEDTSDPTNPTDQTEPTEPTDPTDPSKPGNAENTSPDSESTDDVGQTDQINHIDYIITVQ
ncbi:LCP family protein [Dehalobacter sp. DCM]|uniref:LCP family protein n=1 Tax=Dehalobacter sp. DCM TaxID=2907827 RepID=UPI003081329C|nr:LCP family protein [Dehalobacter sp. DCM]